MPTPDDADVMLSPPAEEHESLHSGRPTCPPDESRIHTSSETVNEQHSHFEHHVDALPSSPAQQPSPPADTDPQLQQESHNKIPEAEVEGPVRDIPTPMSAVDEGAEERRNTQAPHSSTQATAPTTSWYLPDALPLPVPKRRFSPNSTSSFLRPGSRFEGNQTSSQQKYDVQVEIKYVDMKESFLCGYLRIQGLTKDHPSLTTYFEGEIIGNKYSFVTQHPEWGSTEQVDRQHWGRFPAYKPLAKHSSPKDLLKGEHLFMRWKEYFLVPDHRVRTINGASFEGFYYICCNLRSGSISGIYFHAKSEKLQQLELNHINDFGCQGAIEFR
ncbi:hypothetical protein GQ43DRAFT_464401 [Delitschia confertaspora ATCC 74209]|uniref:Vacuolar import and degradation protein n=1 Tax=Delitschia confertaspora ATCC 74209 TaxID=1513339 RepID=A0A9P4JNX9_9PLEO|nr:hypothetical protein GQ43DRAFT_464401 [Delitschia confertaspora ATCC 74209]